MKIGLIDVDGHNFPNLPLMKISAFHKYRGDGVSRHGTFAKRYISKKALIKAAGDLYIVYIKEDAGSVKSKEDFFYCYGVADAVGYICKKVGVNITEIIKESKEEENE